MRQQPGAPSAARISQILHTAGHIRKDNTRNYTPAGFVASPSFDAVMVAWRRGSDTSDLTPDERDDTAATQAKQYAQTITAAGYSVTINRTFLLVTGRQTNPPRNREEQQ